MSAQKLEVSLGGSAPRPAASHAAFQRSSLVVCSRKLSP